MKAIQISNPAEILGAATELIEKPLASPWRKSARRHPQAETQSLTALVRQANRSHQWENAVWTTVAFASLALLVLSFGF